MKKRILKKAKRALSLLLVLLMVVPMTISLAIPVSAETVKYKVEGGYIYFDLLTGVITDCDMSVTKADIPLKINEVSVTCIGTKAFYECESLESITIPESVTTIEREAFYGCKSLISIVIPNSLTNIEYHAFIWCNSLTEVYIEDLESWLKIDFGSVYPALSNPLSNGARLYINNKLIVDLIVPEYYTTINDFAFYGCGSIESVTIPQSVTSIGHGAFSDCNNLINVYYLGDEINYRNIIIYPWNNCLQEAMVYFNSCIGEVEHTYGFGYNETGHYKECIVCGKKINVTVHVFDNGCDTNCDCGYTRTTTHNYQYTFDKINHYDQCNVCGEKVNVETHVFDNACDTNCDCGYTRTTTHSYQLSYDISNHYNECTACGDRTNIVAHMFDNSCDTTCDCGYTRKITHSYKPSYDETNHYNECTVCGDKTNVAVHIFDNACDTNCDCGYTRATTHNYQYTFDKINHYGQCTICGDKINVETHVFDNACDTNCDCGYTRTITHSYRPLYDSSNHYNECTVCGDKTNVAAHTFDNACDAKCICGYTRLITHTYQLKYDESKHYEECTICRNKIGVEPHIYDNACDNDCSVCGYVRTVSDHIYDNSCDTDCNECGYSRVTEHIYDNDCDEDCNVCGFVRVAPLTLEYNKYTLIAAVVGYQDTLPSIVDIPEKVVYQGKEYSITTIANYAFSNCSWLESVVISNSIKTIDRYAFKKCSSLSFVTIPDSITKIENGVFSGCTDLEKIVIGDNVSEINISAFDGCSSLVEIEVEKFNSTYSSVDGVLFNKEGTTLLIYPDGKKGDYVVPNEVMNIGSNSFDNAKFLTSVVIPEGVWHISPGAFKECTALESVTLGKGISYIYSEAFYGCSSLTSIVIPDSVKTMGHSVFYGCNNLREITLPFVGTPEYSNTKYFGYIFGNLETNESCVPESLKRVTITAATYIYPEAFYGCENIESIGLPNTLTWIGGSAFENCSSLTSIVVPDSIESIGKFAFRGCNSLEKITIPFVGGKQDENEYFGYIFGADSFVPSSLKEIVITNETAIKEYAFYNLSEIESIVFTHEISSIDKGAFEGCSGLSDVWYGGTKAQAGSIIIGNENDYLINAVWHYESCLTKESHNYDYTCDVSCDICGYVREVEADAHIFGEWIITIEPTVSREGERIRQCENCDFAEIEMLEKLPEDKPIEYPNPFKDIKKGKWYTEAVLWCNYFGYMNGVSETMFGYKHNVTRAMFATILAKIDGSEISGYNEMSFTDVKAGQWYSNAIEWAYQNGYAAGLGDGYFGRKENVSREQIALFFYTYSSKNGIDVSEQAKLNGYTDLGKVHSWALDAVKWAVAKGLISGTSETTLSPRDSATRAEIALIIKNYVENIVNGTNNPSFTGKWVGTKYNNDSLAGYNAPIPELTITYNSDGSYSIFAKWDSQDVADSYFWYFEGVYDEEKSGIVYTGYHEKTVYDPITDDSGIERVYNNGSGIISIQNGELKFNPTNNDRTLELITFEITDAVI